MTGHGTLVLGGVVAGGISADITFDADGSKWTFSGVLAGAELGLTYSIGVMGDFPGYSHMAGACFFGVLGASAGDVGTITVTWRDMHGEIGTVKGDARSEAISVAGGAGSWSKN